MQFGKVWKKQPFPGLSPQKRVSLEHLAGCLKTPKMGSCTHSNSKGCIGFLCKGSQGTPVNFQKPLYTVSQGPLDVSWGPLENIMKGSLGPDRFLPPEKPWYRQRLTVHAKPRQETPVTKTNLKENWLYYNGTLTAWLTKLTVTALATSLETTT